MAKYQLKDTDGGFYDDETGLDVSRDQVVDIDVKKGAGTKTMQMIQTGGLIEVKTGAGKQKAAEKQEDTAEGSKTSSRTTAGPKSK